MLWERYTKHAKLKTLPVWSNNDPPRYGRFKQTGSENLEPYQCRGYKTWQRCAERTILLQHKYPPGYPSKKSLRGGYAPSRMRPKTKRWRKVLHLISQRNGVTHPVGNTLLRRGKPVAANTKTHQQLGGFSPNLGVIHIQLQCPNWAEHVKSLILTRIKGPEWGYEKETGTAHLYFA